MKHTASAVSVFQTTDYSMFSTIDGNRAINKKKVERIMNEIVSGNDILDHVPILVHLNSGRLQILDGQHRFEVAKKLGRPVHYIIRPAVSLYHIAKVNTNVEKWKSSDFINCYIKAGNNNYKKISEFQKKYGIAIGMALILLANGQAKMDAGSEADQFVNAFQRGEFEVKKWKEAVQFAEICKSFEKTSYWNSRSFMIAIQKILDADLCDFDRLIKLFNDDPTRLKQQAGFKNYLVNLEEIYNIGFSKRRTIYR